MKIPLKVLSLTVCLSTVSIASTSEIVFSRSSFVNNNDTGAPKSSLDSLICYFKTQDGQIINLERLCIKNQQQPQCNPAYPDICVPMTSAKLTCGDIPYRTFRVLPTDPYKFDRNNNQIGCESILEEFNPQD